MSILIFFIVYYILFSISLYFLFPKAGINGWKGLVPILNIMECNKLIGQPSWRIILFFVPIVNIFVWAAMCVDVVRSFGKDSFLDSFIAVVYAPISFFKLAFNDNEKYEGPILNKEKEYFNSLEEAKASGKDYELKKLIANDPFKKSQPREWAEAIIFAVFAAAFIRMFLIEAYKIPTSSMEGSLLVGDFLFVSKAHYGIRTPQTVAMFPLLHNRLPFVDGESYLKNPSLPYFRLPAINKIKRNFPVVFNYPEGDSVYLFPGRTYSVHDMRRYHGNPQFAQKERLIKSGKIKMITRPIDKMDHYIKRCVAIAGDTIQIKNRQLFINGEKAVNPKKIQYRYKVRAENGLSRKKLDELDIEVLGMDENAGVYDLILNADQKNALKSFGNIQIEIMDFSNVHRPTFPHDEKSLSWNSDNFGPLWIPKKNTTVTLTQDNIAELRRVITAYEGNTLVEKDGKFIINGEETNKYTIQLDYYWMMGDNRHNSEDSRYWGYVPETHVVGKPLFIWFSTKDGDMRNGINWSRIFTTANKM